MSDKYAKREERADVTEPPLEGGTPTPPFAETELPAERVVVYGDASATYGSMVAPEVIRPHAGKLDEVLEPERQRQKREEEPKEEELEEELESRHKEEHKHKKGHK